ncbi:Cenpb protein homeodomainlike, partial [Globisporangium splendens]
MGGKRAAPVSSSAVSGYQTGQLDYSQKKAICLKKQATPKITQEQLRQWAKTEFRLVKAPGQSTISDILKHADTILALDSRALESKRVRSVTFPELDLALANWVLQCEARKVKVYNDLIKAQAAVFCGLLGISPQEMRFSGGWLESFKDRHGFNSFKSLGKASTTVAVGDVAGSNAGDATGVSIIPGTNVDDKTQRIRDIRGCSAKYPVQDIYAMQETGLFYKFDLEAARKYNARVTVALCTNADGSDRRDPLVIGMYKDPKCFEGKTAEQYGFYYRSNRKSWMTGLLFRDWVERFNSSMGAAGRKVLLLLDSATSHVVTGLELANVEIQLLPVAATTKLQPLDAGIIRAFKLKYRALHMQHALDQAEELQRWMHSGARPRTSTNIYSVSQLTAMRWIESTWREISDETILNCFQMHNLTQERTKTRQSMNQIERELEAELMVKMDFLRAHDPMIDTKVLSTEEEESTMPVHQTFNPEDFIDKLTPEEEAENKASDEQTSALASYTISEKLDRVRSVILMMNEFSGANDNTIRSLRDLQQSLKDQQASANI